MVLTTTDESDEGESSGNDTGSPGYKVKLSRKRSNSSNSPSPKNSRNSEVTEIESQVSSNKQSNSVGGSVEETSNDTVEPTPPKRARTSSVKTPIRITKNPKSWDTTIAQKSAEIVARGKEKQANA